MHARALVTRGLAQAGGAAADAFEALVGQELAVGGALALWRQARMRVAAMERPEEAAHAFMKLTGTLALGHVWARLGAAAERSPDPERYARIAGRVAADLEATAAYWAALCRPVPLRQSASPATNRLPSASDDS
jgi:hypothetical protein